MMMMKTKGVQGRLVLGLCWVQVVLGAVLDCWVGGGSGCSVSVQKVLDRAVQHTELISRLSEETSTLFEEMFIPLSLSQQSRGGHMCTTSSPVPTSRSHVQQISDKWLLHSVLILIQFWVEPLGDLQASLDQYDNAPNTLINKTKYMTNKLMNLEQGVLVLIRKMLDEESVSLQNNESSSVVVVRQVEVVEHVMRDFTLLSCFKKDAHKMETFLKLLKCRQTDPNRPRCSFI